MLLSQLLVSFISIFICGLMVRISLNAYDDYKIAESIEKRRYKKQLLASSICAGLAFLTFVAGLIFI